jgi:predicted nucleic acid-binding protein
MGKVSCLDTGVITLLYSQKPPDSIRILFKQIKNNKIVAHVISPIISEVFFHICNLNGKVSAENIVANFLNTYPIKLVNLNQSLIIKAGILKCQHYNILSYNDCFIISYCLNKKCILHTTEKHLKENILSLRLKLYTF